MVQRVLTLCDLHAAQGEDADAVSPPTALTLNGRATELDLCPACKEWLQTYLDDYFQVGRRRTDHQQAVPLPTHTRQARLAADVPRTPNGKRSIAMIPPAEDGWYYCDQPYCVRSQPGHGFPTPQQISTHRRNSHGIDRARHLQLLADAAPKH